MKNQVLTNNRILLVDDHRPIHDDFHDILTYHQNSTANLDQLESSFFGDAVITEKVLPQFELFSAFQGQQALQKVIEAQQNGSPYALSFMDVRMPPGWDGVETIQKIWEVDPHIQMVICTAYADYTWEEIYKLFGNTDNLVFLRKPFDHTEVRQLAATLTQKWRLSKLSRIKMEELEVLVKERTEKLENTVGALTEALKNVKTLEGLVPICAYCKKIRDDKGFWNNVESYVAKRTKAQFSHGICPHCLNTHFPAYAKNPQSK